MRIHGRQFRLSFWMLLLVMVLALQGPASAVTITGQRVGNVTPFSFDVVWQVSESSEPALRVYSDSEGLNEITGTLKIEYFPMDIGDMMVSNNYPDRLARRTLLSQSKTKDLVFVRVHDLVPASDYYVRVIATDPQGNDITTDGPLPFLAARTALENEFVSESRLLRMDFNTTVPVQGAIAILDTASLPYPLFEVVGSGNTSESAVFNLDRFLDAAGITNLNPSNPLNLMISLMGAGVPGGVMDYTVPFSGGFTSAEFLDSAFLLTVDSFQFDPIGNQTVGTPFTVTITALDAYSNLITNYDSDVEITTDLALSDGGGTVQGFADGKLSHSMTFAESGIATVTATKDAVSGTSNSFNVFDITYQLTTGASPTRGGTVTGAGTYVDGSDATIEAIPHPNFMFDGWIGDGITDLNAASTSVSMTSDRLVTAEFIDDPTVIDYEEWKLLKFGQQSGDPVITAPGYDFDLDLRSNLFEFATGQDPTVKDTVDANPSIQLGTDGVPVFSYVYDSMAVNLEISIMTSSNMSDDWIVHVPDPADVVETDLGGGIRQVEVHIRTSAGEPLYLRFSVVLTSP